MVRRNDELFKHSMGILKSKQGKVIYGYDSEALWNGSGMVLGRE